MVLKIKIGLEYEKKYLMVLLLLKILFCSHNSLKIGKTIAIWMSWKGGVGGVLLLGEAGL